MKRTYNASEIAKYIINYSIRKKHKDITNLKLQKVLYYVWIDYFKSTQQYLFTEPFYAWQLGPVLPDVYFEYCYYTANPIREQPMSKELEAEMAVIIDGSLDELLNFSAYQLVERVHREDGAWHKAYSSPNGIKSMIDYTDIINLEATV